MKKRITLERTYSSTLEDVWELWTTKDGIESWWGPDGFSVKVHTIDLRPQGKLTYAMIATAAPQIAFMKKAGMPLLTEAEITYTEVERLTRLAYDHLTDFIPGVAPYSVATTVDFRQTKEGVKMLLTIDPMHDQTWTGRMVAGWDSELGKLEKTIAYRHRT
jgi:uncharacterized protein YndB with AHSA1/START domain